jgi:hypothetical protein
MEAVVNTIPNMRLLIISAVLMIALLAALPASAQHAERDKALAVVDEAHRAPITELLNRLVEYEQTRQWDKLYDIISAEFRRGRSKDEFVGDMLSASYEMYSILDFALKLTYVNDPPYGRYTFAGCSDVYGKGMRERGDIYITVIFEDGRWRISEVTMLSACRVPPELKCKEGG